MRTRHQAAGQPPYGPSRPFLPLSPRGSSSLPSLFAHFLHRLAGKSNLKLPDYQTDDVFRNWKVSCRQWLTNWTHCLPLWYCGRNLAMSGTFFFGTSGNFFWLLWQFCTFSGNLVLPPPSSRAISFTISISAAAAKTGNKSKVIKAVAQRQECGGEEEGTKL